MTELLNPYIAGAPVTDERMFFGREDVFEWIEHNLAGQYADHILVIHGQRRVGKTSVLRQLPSRLPSRYIPVFFDLQGRTHTTLDRFLWWLSREIVRVLKQDRAQAVPLPDKDAFSHDPDYLEGQFLPNLRSLLGDHVLLLTFDEFDCLEEAEIKDSLGRPLVDYLRRLMGQPGLNFIFSIGSSGRKLENMQASYTEFFKAALYKKISYLQRRDAHNLIASPVRGLLEYEPDAVAEIFGITSGHPYFTQLICHELFARCLKTEVRRIQKDDVVAVLDDVVERGTVNLKFVWDEATDLEKWCLASLAHMPGKVELRTLGEFLRKQRVRFGNLDLESSLVHLREKDILTSDNRFIIDLLRLWLTKNRPVEQVREELTEVNPISNRYTEIGLEFRDNGQLERAIESFQRALEIDADSLQALIGVAQVHLDQKAYPQAITAFEAALAVDDEDVPARAGLCDAHLALGDLALTKGKAREAIQSYERVLAINADHTEARQRMAEIHRRRGERALADGKGEQALSDFAAALKYTPEDEGLVTRYTEVREQWRAAVVSELAARAAKEQASGSWDQAIATMEEALALDPEDVVLQEKVHSLRGRRREAQLHGLRSRAEQLAKAERWDEALAAWTEVLYLAPEDRQSTQDQMARVEKARSVAQSYIQAQEALAKKEYEQAIRLLKAIVVEDEGYKDAIRLMAQAIEGRRVRRRFWRSPGLWDGIAGGLRGVSGAVERAIRARRVRLGFGIGVGLMVVIGGFLAIAGYLQGNRRSPLQLLAGPLSARPTETPPSAPTSAPSVTVTSALSFAVVHTPTVPVTPTPRPTETAVFPPTASAQPTWVTAFAQPILDAIADRAPNFQDDFADKSGLWRVKWGCPGMEYEGGELVLKSCPVYRENIDYPDIVAEVDGRFMPGTATEDATWGIGFRQAERPGYRFGLWFDGQAGLWGFESGESAFPDAAKAGFETNHLLLIAKGAKFAFYVNDQPLAYIEDDTNRWGTIMFVLPTGYEYTFGKPVIVALDNFRLWDISDVAIP